MHLCSSGYKTFLQFQFRRRMMRHIPVVMNYTPAHLVGSTPLQQTPKVPGYWSQSAQLLKKSGALLTQSGVLAFMAPLLQAEIGIHVWVTVLVCIGMYLAALFYLTKHPRIHFWFCSLALVLIGLLVLALAVKPFHHMPKQTYVTVAGEGHSIFDLQRYVSGKIQLSPNAMLVIANHPVHQWMAGFLHELSESHSSVGEGGIVRWVRQQVTRHFEGQIIFLTPTQRKGGTVVPLALTTRQREDWTDLSGARCTSYAFTFGVANIASFSLDLKSMKRRTDGATRIGTDLRVNLISDEDSQKMRFHLRSTPESIHWEDVMLYGEYDARAASYIALLTELLNSDNLRHYWAEHGAQLWQSVPNEREMLRILLLKARLDSISASGNVFRSQQLPELIRVETILAGNATAPESLAQDLLFYWAAKNFVKLNKGAGHRFERTVKSLKASLAGAAPALEPTFFEGSLGLQNQMKMMFSRILPLNVWRLPSTQRYMSSLDAQQAHLRVNEEPSPESKTLAWLRRTEWNRAKNDILQMHLKRAAPGSPPESKTAAAHAQEPTLESAWEEVETAWGTEFLRRVLKKALGETSEHILNARGFANLAVATDVSEALLLQSDLIEELLSLRQSLWSDTDVYLAKSSMFNALRTATQSYAASGAADAPDISRLPALAGWIEFLNKLGKRPLLNTFMKQVGFDVDLQSEIADSLTWLQSQPRLVKVIAALLSALKTTSASMDSMLQQNAPVQLWLARIIDDASIPPLLLSLLEGGAGGRQELIGKLEAHAATLPVPAPAREKMRRIAADLAPLIDALTRLTPAKPLAEQPAAAELAGHSLILFRDWCYSTKLLTELGALIDRSVFTQEYTVFNVIARANDAPAREFYDRMRTAMRTHMTDRRSASMQTATEIRTWRFINRITWLSNLHQDQQPRAIVRDRVNGQTAFLPACPLLDEWIREVTTASSDPAAKSAYPSVGEALFLDLYLRTLNDETPTGYTSTELGMLSQIFQSITKQSIEDYLADCFASDMKLDVFQSSARKP
jgi:hypothetical protein